MKKSALFAFAATLALVGCKNSQPAEAQLAEDEAVVYLTKDISPEGLLNIYKALGVEAEGCVAIKMSTGEGSNPNYLESPPGGDFRGCLYKRYEWG
ncbi:MAG: hypothetical protein IJU81_08815 [Bacteroidales bacterium]|nr:hypothetical protein [Bacteroidales bacterium]